jgi:FkbM family methyltransferase
MDNKSLLQAWLNTCRIVSEATLDAARAVNDGLKRRYHDPEFAFLDVLRDKAFHVLDIGANRGHAAVSFLSHCRKCSVDSFEPIAQCWPALLVLTLRYPGRFCFHGFGVASEQRSVTLHVPCNGRQRLTTMASVSPQEFDKPHVRECASQHLGEGWYLTTCTVRFKPIAEYARRVDLLKVDVEGSESDVISSLMPVIRRDRPVIVAEANNTGQWQPLLEREGYKAYRFDVERAAVVAMQASDEPTNVIMLHTSNSSGISATIKNSVAA